MIQRSNKKKSDSRLEMKESRFRQAFSSCSGGGFRCSALSLSDLGLGG